MLFQHVDYFFAYKNVLRFILLHKCDWYSNTFQLPTIRYLVIFFSINEIEDLDDPRSYNYYFLSRFFFGNKSFFTKYKSFFSLGRTFYSYNVHSFFSNRYCFFPIFFLVNDILPVINKNHSKVLFSNKNTICFISIFDTNLFLEKKTNAGLYSLANCLNYKIFFSCSDYYSSFYLINILKIF